MKSGYKVADAMTRKPVVVSPSTTIEKCAEIMKENHVGSLIASERGIAEGIITEQDIVREVVAKGLNPKKTRMEDVMEKNIITVSPDKDVFEALLTMRDNNIRHLPVVDDKGGMVGLLTLKDVLKIEPELFSLLVEKFELREEEQKPLASPSEGICQLCGEYSRMLSEVDGVMVCPKCKYEMTHAG